MVPGYSGLAGTCIFSKRGDATESDRLYLSLGPASRFTGLVFAFACLDDRFFPFRRGRFLPGCIQNFAGAIEARTGFDDQIDGLDLSIDATAGNDFQPFGFDIAFHATADDHVARLDLPVYAAFGADHDGGLGADVALGSAVYMQVVTQGEIADKLGIGRDDGGSMTLNLSRTVFAKDCH